MQGLISKLLLKIRRAKISTDLRSDYSVHLNVSGDFLIVRILIFSHVTFLVINQN
jgi:hypothetical protein